MNRTLVALVALSTVTAACGDDEFPFLAGGGELDPYVEVPEPGDAEGNGFSGVWGVELVWTACSGTCAIDTVFGVASVCDVGTIRQDRAVVEQTGGDLQIDLEGEDLRFLGGVNADGSFDVLSVSTQYGGELDIRVRAKGTFDGFDMAADASSHSVGQTDGGALNCWGSVEITADSLE